MITDLPHHIDRRHCILTKQYAVYTPPIDAMAVQIGDWIDQQRPGGYIYGASRLGKTRAIVWYLGQVLEERFGAVVPLVIWNHVPPERPVESAFWHQLLLASKFEFISPTKAPKRTDGQYLCVQRFITLAENAGSNFVLLLIDEAQEMTLSEWKWLVALQNLLEQEGYLLSVFSVGSHQLGYKHEYLASTGNAHVAARFMAAHARFHGIQSVEELGYVINGYDIDSEWPAGSGKSFLAYFAASHYDAGRRLREHTDLLWEALLKLRPDSASRYTEFPMQHIARAIEESLIQLARGRDWDEVVSLDNWLDVLAKTNFPDHMRIIATAG